MRVRSVQSISNLEPTNNAKPVLLDLMVNPVQQKTYLHILLHTIFTIGMLPGGLKKKPLGNAMMATDENQGLRWTCPA